jgi:hypothetical protein
MYYMLITVSPVGTMTCKLTTNYMQAEEEDLLPGYFAFVVEAKSFQVRHIDGPPVQDTDRIPS